MKISVIIAAYNIEKYIGRCLKSVINQKLNDTEIIVVDDGSTDNTLSVIKDLIKDKKNIKIIHKKNAGIIEARKSGLKLSKGEYILFMDGDDWLEKNCLEILYFNAIENRSEIVMYNAFIAYDDRKEVQKTFDIFQRCDNNCDCLENLLLGNIGVNIWGKLIKKSFILDNKIEFLSNISYGDDLAISFTLFVKKPKISFVKDCLYNYYKREGSTTNTIDTKILDVFKVISFIEDELKNNDIYEKYKKQFEWLVFEHCFDSKLVDISKFSLEHKYIHRTIYNSFKEKDIVIRENEYIKGRINKRSLSNKIRIKSYNCNYYLGRQYDLLRRVIKNIL